MERKRPVGVMLLMLTLLLGGCAMGTSNIDGMSVPKVIEHLEETYGEEFEMDFMQQQGPGSAGGYASLVGEAWRKDIPEVRFDVVYDGAWYDTYYREMIIYRSKAELNAKVEEIFNTEVLCGNIRVLLVNNAKIYLDEGDFHDLIEKNPGDVSAGGALYLLSEDFDFEKQAQNVLKVERYLLEQGFTESILSVYFVKGEHMDLYQNESPSLKYYEYPEYYDEVYYVIPKRLEKSDIDNVRAGFQRHNAGTPYYIGPYDGTEQEETSRKAPQEQESASTKPQTFDDVQFLSRSEWPMVQARLKMNRNIFVADLDGRNAGSKRDFHYAMQDAFRFPEDCRGEADAVVQSMSDLQWLGEKESYVLHIDNINKQVTGSMKDYIVDFLNQRVLPNMADKRFEVYWEE